MLLRWFAGALILATVFHSFAGQATESKTTFNKDVAPIVFRHCVECHRPDGGAPFGLLTYEDVRSRARLISDVTESRLMPPWPPEPGHGDFLDVRGLSETELVVIQNWITGGMIEGDQKDLPTPPPRPPEWSLGKPDLIVSVGDGYLLPADGKDVYRNFVSRIPVEKPRYVRAVEFVSDNENVVHHAFFKIDETGESRRMDGQDELPGFEGMNVRATMPPGNFLSWQPGTNARPHPNGMNWRLGPGTDLVVQMHLRPTGKPETVGGRVGLYFSDDAPTEVAERVALASLTLDIPPDEMNYVVEDSFVLPVDARITAVLPHAHYLAREMEGFAVLPDGSRRELLWIRNWDFNWQGHYQYREPVRLPKGSELHMRFHYDNSAGNPQNPTLPPARVRYGADSTDEMAELWFQVVLESEEDRKLLVQSYHSKKLEMFRAEAKEAVRQNPTDAVARLRWGVHLLGIVERQAEAVAELRRAIYLDPNLADAHYYLGLWNRSKGRFNEAVKEFGLAVAADPKHSKSLGNLGVLFAEHGQLEQAKHFLLRAVAADPNDQIARELLRELKAN